MPGHDRIADAVAIAEAVLSSRFPGALFGVAAGSIIRGEGTPSSDIDLVVMFEHLDAAWRESFVADGFPVEAFVHDPATLAWFVDQDVAGGCPVLVGMIAEGRPIGIDLARAADFQAEARETLSRGPPPMTAERRDFLRYQITDLLDDLRGEPPPAEIRAISARLYQPLADLILLGRGRWTGRGKWIPRLIGDLDERLLRQFDRAFRLLAEGRSDAVVALAQGELARHGGLLFAGDRREAPAGARLGKDV